ncbi:hypothetical protein R3P38DRAFT_3608471 [Favolaschia claudopus]|uniref:Uncharacterized protein n=1 Tax=Favolaschia claudopus TaxID=2862362 RepID=A0AAW0DKE8_9AGAR
MFFARAFLLAGFVVPAVLGFPSAVAEPRAANLTGKALVVNNGKAVITKLTSLKTAMHTLKQQHPNKAAVLDTAQKIQAVIIKCAGPPTSGTPISDPGSGLGGLLSGNGGLLSGLLNGLLGGLLGGTSSSQLYGGLLDGTLGGLISNLLNGLLGGLLGGPGPNSLAALVAQLLGSLKPASAGCGCGGGLDGLLEQVVQLVQELVVDLNGLLGSCQSCGTCGQSGDVYGELEPLVVGLLAGL